MKTFLLVVLSVTALFVWQRKGDDGGNEAQPTREAPAVASTPARTISEHNWAKHSLDRAHEVIDQVQVTRAQNEP